MERQTTIALLATTTLTGCPLQVGRTEALWLLWLVPLALLFVVWSFRAKTRIMRRFASADMLVRIASGVSRPRQVLKTTLVIAALAFAVLALTEPRYGFTWEDVQRQGVDIVVALDVSDSMLVEDVETGGQLSRLERAKREITDLLRILEGDRVGLVAFAGTAFLECPLTLDYAAAEIFLDDIDTDLIPVKGTAIGTALRESIEAFEGGSHESRAIILITDGEDHSGEAQAAAEEAKAAGVRVFTIGIGRDQGSPIPKPGGGFHKDRSGSMVLSRLDETGLQRIALTTGGSYVRSVTGDVDLEKIYDQGIKATLEDQELASKRRKRWEERFQWLVALALVLLALEPFISERRRAAATAVLALALVPSLAGAQPAQPAPASAAAQPAPPVTQPATPPGTPPAREVAPTIVDDPYRAYELGLFDQSLQAFVDEQVDHPRDPAVMMNIGAAHYQMKSYQDAEKAFSEAALLGDDATRARAFYNLGNVAYRQGRLDEAIKLYQAALELDPNDQDAKFNIEFVRDEIRRRHEEAQKQQQQQQQQEQAQQQQQQPQGGNQQQSDQPDRDRDGLPDELETSADNPTDPDKRDTDGDTLADGDEDLNRNGRVDPGETDPTKKDTDGDGTPDAEEERAVRAEQPSEPPPGMTPEQADQYLNAVEEDRPDERRKVRGRRTRPVKDW